MTITDKTRKMLWGKSGNRCAICKLELVIDRTENDEDSVVGEECHIVSEKTNGPRHRGDYPEDQFDSYDNLLLLCRVHHKMIDDQVDTFSEDILKQIKTNHENWVTDKLSDKSAVKPLRLKRIKENIPSILHRVTSGKDLFEYISGSLGYNFEHDEPKNDKELELISGFFQSIKDFADLFTDNDSGDLVKLRYEFSKAINELEEQGYIVFCAIEKRILEGGMGAPSEWKIAYVHVYHKDIKEIIKPDRVES